MANTLLASPYPGAAVDPVASAQSKTEKVYFSHSSLATVRAWYQKQYAKKSAAACSDSDEGCGQFKQQCETVTRTDQMTRCSDFMVLKWNAIPPGGSMVDAYNAGVHLEGWKKIAEPHEKNNSNTDTSEATGQMANMMAQLNAMSQQMQAANQQITSQIQQEGKQMGVDVAGLSAIPDIPFAGLKQEVLAGRHSQKELDTIYHRYQNLETSVYPMTKGENGPVAYNKFEYDHCKSKLMTKNAYMLGAQGADQWNAWLTCIKKIAAHAYQTRIVINP